jgi:ribonuclease HI
VETDSQLVVSQVKGEAQVKGALLQKYLATVKEKIDNFDSIEIVHIPREQNTRADVLSKLATTRENRINHSFV